MMSRTTPGPYSVKEIIIRGQKKFELRAGVKTGRQRVAIVDFEEDVPQFAKAPEMREALCALVTACDWLNEDSDDPAERRAYMDAVDNARALLAALEKGA